MEALLIQFPPPEYDPLVQGVLRPYIVQHVTGEELARYCAGAFDPRVEIIWGCTDATPALLAARVYIREDLTGDLYQAVLRHEVAHVNGWRHE